jgi:hypothetical protein
MREHAEGDRRQGAPRSSSRGSTRAAERLGTVCGACRIELDFYDGHLKGVQASPRIKASELHGFGPGPGPRRRRP